VHVCATDELEELWNVKVDPIEERYHGGANNGSVYPGQEVLQVLANACEPQPGESGEVNACQQKWTLASPIGAGRRGLESKIKGLEAGQPGQVCHHRFGRKVPSMWHTPKRETDKLSRR
jgi:hypothetical protein